MIQRFQTLFMSFSIISLVVIIVNFPILINNTDKYYIENFPLIKYIMLASVFLTTYSIFQYKKLKRQRLLVSFSRLIITIGIILIVVLYKKDYDLELGFYLLLIPFIFLLISDFLIKKDQKLIKSADRIR
ncbi:MAG: hypothetical protein CMD36_02790 [Flavobacteriales bacterium]|nr:hypothetical protein [Flavobacteriales bacterium]|tara:strand:+ start:1246 stop:1635 length:390 start_codon:yes stop_codon:yes gene_type:complete